MNRPAVFLDRDGVIIQEKHFLIDPSMIEYIPGAIEALQSLNGFFKIVISNQSGVARGFFTSSDVEAFQYAMAAQLRDFDVNIDSWRFCPHSPDDNCNCRKPKPGMIFEEAARLSIDLDRSWLVGDKRSDIAAGKAAGIKTIMVRTGYAGNEPDAEIISPDYWADDLSKAAEIINSLR